MVEGVIVALWDSITMLADHRLGLSCYASLDALGPCVPEFRVLSSPAVSEPRTPTSTAIKFAGFLDGATGEAYGIDGRRLG